MCHVRELHQERDDRERERLDTRRLLDERMAEVSLAFRNAETDEVKRLNEELRKEKSKGKKVEEKNKRLCKVKFVIKVNSFVRVFAKSQ